MSINVSELHITQNEGWIVEGNHIACVQKDNAKNFVPVIQFMCDQNIEVDDEKAIDAARKISQFAADVTHSKAAYVKETNLFKRLWHLLRYGKWEKSYDRLMKHLIQKLEEKLSALPQQISYEARRKVQELRSKHPDEAIGSLNGLLLGLQIGEHMTPQPVAPPPPTTEKAPAQRIARTKWTSPRPEPEIIVVEDSKLRQEHELLKEGAKGLRHKIKELERVISDDAVVIEELDEHVAKGLKSNKEAHRFIKRLKRKLEYRGAGSGKTA